MVEYLENFLTNMAVKEFWKSVHICQSCDKKNRVLFFWDTVYNQYPVNHDAKMSTSCLRENSSQNETWMFVFFVFLASRVLAHMSRGLGRGNCSRSARRRQWIGWNL